MIDFKSFPIENKVEEILKSQSTCGEWFPTGQDKSLYVNLSEPIVRLATAWQDDNGLIIDPYEPDDTTGFSSYAAARFVGALGFLIRAGRCEDLIDNCARSLDITTHNLSQANENPLRGAEFYPKELMQGLLALKNLVSDRKFENWSKLLGSYDPEQNYDAVLSKRKPEELHNFVTFAIAGETCKKKFGIADNSDFIERHIETQYRLFSEFGMYRDPNDPMTYDYTSRMNIALTLFWDYDADHHEFLNEILRRGALSSLLFISPTGEAPFGGRSNQYHFNEATIAVICEYEARRYKKLGDLRMAGAFKRTARLAAMSIKPWLDISPIRYLKNGFPPELQHGRASSYGFYGIYSLLIASQLGFAHLLADETIEEQPAPFEIGGYALHLPSAFHKVFATCQGYHIEIDTNADPNYDATGLGRIHRIGIPSELALSAPIAPNPKYLLSVENSPRSVAIGPGWIDSDGETHWLADYSQKNDCAEVDILKEDPQTGVELQVKYPISCGVISEHYLVNADGVLITDTISGHFEKILVQIPLLETNGLEKAKIKTTENGFIVLYQDFHYIIECLYPSNVEVFLEPFSAPNRNAIYRVGCFKTDAEKIVYKLHFLNKNVACQS